MWGRGGGFTLIELIVVIMIIGLLASYAVPAYMKSMEASKADFAVGILKTIGASNRFYALDNQGTYVTGAMDTSCGNYGSCSGTSQNVCNLIGCKYIVSQDWDRSPYTYTACDARTAGACAGVGGGSNYLAVAKRVVGASPGAPAASPYAAWAYTMDINGKIDTAGNAPLPQGY